MTGIVATGHALSEAVATTNAIIKTTDIPNNISTDISGDFEGPAVHVPEPRRTDGSDHHPCVHGDGLPVPSRS